MIGRLVAVAYVAAVAALTAIAFWDDASDNWPAKIAAAALGLPLVVPAFPVIYVVGGLAWNGPMWLVTVTFTSLMAAVACGNVWLVRAVATGRARTRSGASPAPARPGPGASSRRRSG